MLFTSESVTEGHPDKICDQISDALVDAMIEEDPKARIALDTTITNGVCFIAGEVTTDCYVDISKVARGVIRDIGYTDAKYGFHWETSGVIVSIKEQSSDIARGVDSYTTDKRGKILKEDLSKLGAGDQGIMFGYATNETDQMMPLPIVIAHKLTQKLAEVRKKKILKYLRPDGKAQVTIEYDQKYVNKKTYKQKNNKTIVPKKIDTVVIACQHDVQIRARELSKDIRKHVVEPVINKFKIQNSKFKIDNYKLLINTTGKFVIGGPQADTGQTGRKNIVDTYGGMVRHGGGAFSGKDPTKVDRSGQYAARWVAKHFVAAGLADKIELQISYAIGIPEPLAIYVDTFGTGKVSDEKIIKLIRENFDLRPGVIIKELKLRSPIYRQVACYGHFGRDDLDLPWERLDKGRVERLQKTLL